jgi:predicted RNA polymerase sigma factor
MTDTAWIDNALTSARPQAVGALLRYFRNLDTAEEAFQEACLRALRSWPEKGPPRDPAAWLIFVGRNSGIDAATFAQLTQLGHRGRPAAQAIEHAAAVHVGQRKEHAVEARGVGDRAHLRHWPNRRSVETDLHARGST